MSIDRIVMMFAGAVNLISLALSLEKEKRDGVIK